MILRLQKTTLDIDGRGGKDSSKGLGAVCQSAVFPRRRWKDFSLLNAHRFKIMRESPAVLQLVFQHRSTGPFHKYLTTG